MKRQKKIQSWGNTPTSMFTNGLLFYPAREHPFCVAAHGKEGTKMVMPKTQQLLNQGGIFDWV